MVAIQIIKKYNKTYNNDVFHGNLLTCYVITCNLICNVCAFEV